MGRTGRGERLEAGFEDPPLRWGRAAAALQPHRRDRNVDVERYAAGGVVRALLQLDDMHHFVARPPEHVSPLPEPVRAEERRESRVHESVEYGLRRHSSVPGAVN